MTVRVFVTRFSIKLRPASQGLLLSACLASQCFSVDCPPRPVLPSPLRAARSADRNVPSPCCPLAARVRLLRELGLWRYSPGFSTSCFISVSVATFAGSQLPPLESTVTRSFALLLSVAMEGPLFQCQHPLPSDFSENSSSWWLTA